MQEALFPNFVLYRLRLLLELGERRQTLPAYLGSTVRGIFAASFRRVVCVTRAPVCDGCLLLQRCPYPYIFETPPPSHLSESLQHLLAAAACQVHSEDAYDGHLVLRLMGGFILFYTARVMCKGRVTMEEIVLSLKHYWRFVNSEALELQGLSWGADANVA